MHTIRTGNKGLLQTEVRVGGGLIPIELDGDMESTEWQVYQGDEPASKRYRMGVETNIRGEMRKAVQGLLDAEEPKQIVTTPPTREPALPNPDPEPSPPPKVETKLALVPTAEMRPAETMTDEETGEIVTITASMRLEAEEVHKVVVFNDKQSSFYLLGLGDALKRIRDERLYLALGLPSFSAYCEGFKLSRQVAYDRITASESNAEIRALQVVAPVRQVSYTNNLLLGKAHPDDRRVVVEENDVSDMSKRKVEAALKSAKEQRERAEAAERRAADADAARAWAELETKEARAENESLRNQPPQVVDRPVEMIKSDPSQAQETELLRQKLLEAEKGEKKAWADYEKLRKQADEDYNLTEKLTAKRAEFEDLKRKHAELKQLFDDGQRKPEHGFALLHLIRPIGNAVLEALPEVRKMNKEGVGGWCPEEDLILYRDRFKELTAEITAIIKDRSKRDLAADFKEVD